MAQNSAPTFVVDYRLGAAVPDNPNVSRTWATLRIWGPDLDPDSVTRQLGIDPIYSHQRGDRRNPKAPPYKHGMWALRTKRILLTTDLEEHIVWILDRMEPVRAQFMGLRVAGVSTDIFCFLESVGHGGPVFQPSTLGRIAALDLQLGIEVFYADEIPQ